MINLKETAKPPGICKFSSLLIVTYGRSGSTLLQGILNCIPGVLVKGENKNFIFPLFQSFKRMYEAKKISGNTPAHPWYGTHSLNPQSFAKALQLPIREQIVGNLSNISCYGFKEVRYGWTSESQIKDSQHLQNFDIFEEYLLFLALVFPNVCFVFNTRDSDSVLQSAWWRNRQPNVAHQHLESLNKNFALFNEKYPEKSFLIDYTDVVQQTDKLKHLFAFLGVEFDEKKVAEVLAQPHSYQPKNQLIAQKHSNQLLSIKKTFNKSLFEQRVEDISFEVTPKEFLSDAVLTISGIAISKLETPIISNIVLRKHNQTIAAKMGIPSLAKAKKFPHNPMAKNARFSISGIKVQLGDQFQLLVHFADHQVMTLAEIEVVSATRS